MASVFYQSSAFPNRATFQDNDLSTRSTTTTTSYNKSNEQYLREIEDLKKQIKQLVIKQDVLEGEKEELVNQVNYCEPYIVITLLGRRH